MYNIHKCNIKSISTVAGLKPALEYPKRFIVFHLNHSVKLPFVDVNPKLTFSLIKV